MCDETGGDGGESTDDTAKREVMSNAFMTYVRASMKDPPWIPEVLSEVKGSKRHPEQGIVGDRK